MAGIISLNGDSSVQPATLKEELLQKFHDRTSINGTYTRIYIAQKYQVTMTFQALTQAQYAILLGYCTGSARTVLYINTDSTINFSGFPILAEDVYYQGASLLKNITITLEQK
jgi:hypothetical protein